MQSTSIFKIISQTDDRANILEKIKKYTTNHKGFLHFLHIVSLNPENLVMASQDNDFAEVIREAQIKIVDGVGVVWAARTLGIRVGERITGVDLMKDMLKVADDLRLRVLLIGGSPNLALNLADCYTRAYPEAKFMGAEGIKNIQKPSSDEELQLFSIVSDYKPHLLFVSFGSPEQELWLYRHKDKLKGMVCMGVGGAFDYEAGSVMRAPHLLRSLGLEWLFRLAIQPWRWRRQLKLIEFIRLVIKVKFTKSVPVHPSGV